MLFPPSSSFLFIHPDTMARKKKYSKSLADEKQLQLFSIEEMLGTENVEQKEQKAEESTIEKPVENQEVVVEEEEKEQTENYIDEKETWEDNHYEADYGHLRESMHRALMILSRLSPNAIRLIAMECATLAQDGLNLERIYRIPALEGMGMDGYDFIALYYASFAQAFPSMIDRINLPYSRIYEEVKVESNYFNS